MFSLNLYLFRYSMFTGLIDSREVQSRRGSSSQSSGGSRGRRTNQEVELERLREELQWRDEYARQQEAYCVFKEAARVLCQAAGVLCLLHYAATAGDSGAC